MMRQLRLLTLFVFVLGVGGAFSQTLNESSPQTGLSPNPAVDCTDPLQASSPECSDLQNQMTGSRQGISVPGSQGVPLLRAPYGWNQDQYQYEYQYMYPPRTPLNPSQIRRPTTLPSPETEFEQMAADSAGRPLPFFGQSLFDLPPSTFAPLDLLQVPGDYIIGAGDGLQVRIWGQLEADLRVTVDRSGQIYIPRVGPISVAGVHYGELEQYLKNEVSKIFRNFNLTATVARLRSIQVLVVGNARYPGTYTISSLSTLVNAIFVSGGPTPQGSLRHIQVRRDGATVTDFDFYNLLIKGDKSKDVRLQPGDVLYIPPVGPLAAISGSVNSPAIYELKGSSTLNDLIEIAGGMSSLADTGRITIERVADHQARKTLEFPYDETSHALPLQDGDIVRVFSIVPSFQDTVTLRGNVANPGRYPWKAGMHIRDLIPDPAALLTRRYWLDRAAIGNGQATEYPIGPSVRCLPASQTTNAANPASTQPGNVGSGAPTTPSQVPSANPSQGGPGAGSSQVVYIPCDANGQAMPTGASSNANGRTPLGNERTTETYEEMSPTQRTAKNVTADLRHYAPEINWDYAIIQRVNPFDLTSNTTRLATWSWNRETSSPSSPSGISVCPRTNAHATWL
jgi:protein involved in polysaccharide export with SLBB domain